MKLSKIAIVLVAALAAATVAIPASAQFFGPWGGCGFGFPFGGVSNFQSSFVATSSFSTTGLGGWGGWGWPGGVGWGGCGVPLGGCGLGTGWGLGGCGLGSGCGLGGCGLGTGCGLGGCGLGSPFGIC